MSMILDVIVLAIIVLVTIIYAKRGMIKSVMGAAGTLLSIIAASLFYKSLGGVIQPLIADKIDSIHVDNSILGKIADTVLGSSAVANAFAFGIIFIAALLICKLLSIILGALFELPVLSGVNRLAGGVLGLIIGLIYAQIISLVLFCFSEFLIGSFDWITADAYGNSIIAKFMFEHNIFSYIF